MGIYYMNPPPKKSSKKKERLILIRGVIFGIALSVIVIAILWGWCLILMGIVGDLGSGNLVTWKTLTLTYYALRTFHKFRGLRKIYANYHLYRIPYEFTPDLTDALDSLEKGLLCADELWLYADSRQSASKRNRFVTSVLAKSRKRDLDIFYTCQYWKSIDLRLRTFTDLCAFPELNDRSQICRVNLGKPDHTGNVNLMYVKKFYAPPVYTCFDTTEEIHIPMDLKEKKEQK